MPQCYVHVKKKITNLLPLHCARQLHSQHQRNTCEVYGNNVKLLYYLNKESKGSRLPLDLKGVVQKDEYAAIVMAW